MRALALGLALMMLPLVGQRSAPARVEMTAMEKSFDQKLQRHSIDAPIDVLGLTRGLYLQGYGAVFSTEVNLLLTAGISPFRPTLSKEEVARVRAAKLKRLPVLRGLMKEMMVSSASSLDRLPVEERVVLGVSLFYNSWEDTTGLPHLIMMEGQRRSLLEVASNRQPKSALETMIQVREE